MFVSLFVKIFKTLGWPNRLAVIRERKRMLISDFEYERWEAEDRDGQRGDSQHPS